MKVKDLKHKPQELPCCETCEHKGKGIKYCVQIEKCEDIYIHNNLYETCWKCNGSGKIRANKFTNGGFPITLNKEKCDECGGTGLQKGSNDK